jgi:polysaccharide export outer membrane protein
MAAGILYSVAAQEAPRSDARRKSVNSETVQDYNDRSQQLERSLESRSFNHVEPEYRIGAGDLLEISVFEATELGRSVRVSESGDISLPLLGMVHVGGRSPHEEEVVLEEFLRRSYIKEPHVSVFVKEIQSHSVSVFGAVKKPGVLQIRGPKTLVEVLSMAEGLAEDAGDTVLVVRSDASGMGSEALAGRAQASGALETAHFVTVSEKRPRAETAAGDVLPDIRTEEINVKSLLGSGDPQFNVAIYPGDLVKVTRAGIIYVVGEVRKPGGFQLKNNENVSVLQAIALAEGLTRTSASSHARIIRTDGANGARREIPINLSRVLAGKIPDATLEPRDILFVPNSASRSAIYRSMEAAVSVGTGIAIYRR